MHFNARKLCIKLIGYLCYILLPFLFWVLVIFGFDSCYTAILTILSSLIHELGHLYAIRNLSARIRPTLRGFLISNEIYTGYDDKIKVYVAGPLFNILAAIIFIPFSVFSEYLFVFTLINLATAISNLLPVKGYDGYGIIKALFEKNGNEIGINLLNKLSFTFICGFTLLSLYLIGKAGEGFWIFSIFFFTFITELRQTHSA